MHRPVARYALHVKDSLLPALNVAGVIDWLDLFCSVASDAAVQDALLRRHHELQGESSAAASDAVRHLHAAGRELHPAASYKLLMNVLTHVAGAAGVPYKCIAVPCGCEFVVKNLTTEVVHCPKCTGTSVHRQR